MPVNVASSRPNLVAKFIICKHQPQLVSAQLTPLCSDHLVGQNGHALLIDAELITTLLVSLT